MSCQGCGNCVQTKCLPACVENVIIGIFDASTEYYIYLTDVTIDQVIRFTATSSGAAILTWPLGNFEPMPDHSYTLEIRKTNEVEQEIIIPYGYYTSDSLADCLAITFYYVVDDAFAKLMYETVEIELLTQ